MKLDDKRKVIEVLLCAGHRTQALLGWSCIGRELFDARVARLADDAWFNLPAMARGECYEHDAIEAAYRLIESSPTLRVEWFGAQ